MLLYLYVPIHGRWPHLRHQNKLSDISCLSNQHLLKVEEGREGDEQGHEREAVSRQVDGEGVVGRIRQQVAPAVVGAVFPDARREALAENAVYIRT